MNSHRPQQPVLRNQFKWQGTDSPCANTVLAVLTGQLSHLEPCALEVTGDLPVQTCRVLPVLQSASEVTHKVPRGSKGSSQRGESQQGGLGRPPRPGLLRDLRGAQELGCTNFDPGVTSSRAFGTLGGAVPYGNSRGRLGRSSEVF